MSDHMIVVESTQVFSASIEPEAAYRLKDGDMPLGDPREIKITYECTCGRRFRKPETAYEHLEELQNDD